MRGMCIVLSISTYIMHTYICTTLRRVSRLCVCFTGFVIIFLLFHLVRFWGRTFGETGVRIAHTCYARTDDGRILCVLLRRTNRTKLSSLIKIVHAAMTRASDSNPHAKIFSPRFASPPSVYNTYVVVVEAHAKTCCVRREKIWLPIGDMNAVYAIGLIISALIAYVLYGMSSLLLVIWIDWDCFIPTKNVNRKTQSFNFLNLLVLTNLPTFDAYIQLWRQQANQRKLQRRRVTSDGKPLKGGDEQAVLLVSDGQQEHGRGRSEEKHCNNMGVIARRRKAE